MSVQIQKEHLTAVLHACAVQTSGPQHASIVSHYLKKNNYKTVDKAEKLLKISKN